jgi:tetratricopeptide (TPR) repeat protein/NADH:ubiquinone oxidoreductase subunit 3 (subunit A)
LAERISKKQQRIERQEAKKAAAVSPDGSLPTWLIRVVACVPVLAALVTYSRHLDGQFLFDDRPTISENQAIHAGQWMQAAFGAHSPVSNRPLTVMTLGLNYSINGLDPRGYHVFSLIVHLANVALLFGIVRRTLRGPVLGGVFDAPMALFTAAGLALPWAVHPLLSEAVTYITQRTTLLMSFFMLLAIYCLLRGIRSPEHRGRWDAGAIAACVGGMMSKEEFVAVPLLLILFERAYVYPSWSDMKKRTGVYIWLVATMLVVGMCVAMGPSNPTAGYHTAPRATAGEWLMTQAHVIVHYLRLAMLPFPLRGAYDWKVVRSFAEPGPIYADLGLDFVYGWSPWMQGVAAVLPGLIVLTLLAATIYLCLTRPWWGWIGAMFFLLLAPTSSILPIISEVAAERRMYLPVLIWTIPTVIFFTLLLDYLRRRYNPSLATCAAVLFVLVVIPNGLAMYGAYEHAAVFRNEIAFWTDVYAKNPCTNRSFQSSNILTTYGKTLEDQGRKLDAFALFQRAADSDDPLTSNAGGNYAASMVDRATGPLLVSGMVGVGGVVTGPLTAHWFAAADDMYRRVLKSDPEQDDPGLSEVRANFAWMLVLRFQDRSIPKPNPEHPLILEAEAVASKSVQLQPFRANSWNVWATTLYYRGDAPKAEQAFVNALRLDPNHKFARQNLELIRQDKLRQAGGAAQPTGPTQTSPQP